MLINIPPRFAARLAHESNYQMWVWMLQNKVESILKGSPVYFPEYTDHGIEHINQVLKLADQLIATATLSDPAAENDLLDPRATAFLICAIIIHDIGMFLKSDGMYQLVYGSCCQHLTKSLDEDTWESAWMTYISKTKRMTEGEKCRLFGRNVEVREDWAHNLSNTTDDDKRIIGEFIRQNHGRLAHEVALYGFPGTTNEKLFDLPSIKDNDRDMIGLLARSHCIGIRETEEYLKRFNEGPMPHNIPAFYLMAVLRMADYLDAREKRAPEILERIQKIRVPASETEWSWNQCISNDASRWDKDAHNFFVSASPTKSTEYVLLDNWLRSVQNELDLCWSVLAEQYPAKPYRLTIHRVRSNIHEKTARKNFEQRFMTREVKITANPRIVELMMEPLYGDDPTYGVRELLQNAVDACVERKRWEEQHNNPNYKGLVDIRIEDNTFTITDNGMGMNQDILLNYYLCAGSTYRSSESWKAANAPDGTPQIARTGKFGVGFLAAFLLGDSIEVHTQHRDDGSGLHFSFDQQSMPLDVERIARTNCYAPDDPTGTTITIKLKQTAIDGFCNSRTEDWYNWYAFDEPEVVYHINGEEKHHTKLSLARNPAENPRWLSLSGTPYETYLWRPHRRRGAQFYCNGIRIYDGHPHELDSTGLDVHFPHISVIDPKGLLNVDLSRRRIKSIPEEDALLREVLRYHIARLLLTPWASEGDYRKNLTSGFELQEDSSWGYVPFLLSRKGFQLNIAAILTALAPEEYVILVYDGSQPDAAVQQAQDFLKGMVPFCIFPVCKDPHAHYRYTEFSDPAFFLNSFYGGRVQLFDRYATQYSAKDHTTTIWLRKDVWNACRQNALFPHSLSTVADSGNLITASCGGRRSKIPIHRDRFQIQAFPVAIHVKPDYHDYDLQRYSDRLFARVLKETLVPAEGYDRDDLWIPFDMQARKEKFPHAFETLNAYMKHIQTDLNDPF